MKMIVDRLDGIKRNDGQCVVRHRVCAKALIVDRKLKMLKTMRIKSVNTQGMGTIIVPVGPIR